MSWAVGIGKDGRDIGYGVPAICDHPKCNAEIDRGLSHICGMINTDGEDRGCGLHFCSDHLRYSPKFGQLCERCWPKSRSPFERKPDVAEWINHKLTDPTWAQWREENSEAMENEHARLTGEGWRLGADGCYRKPPEPCESCDENAADPPSKLCPGCQAYCEHTQ